MLYKYLKNILLLSDSSCGCGNTYGINGFARNRGYACDMLCPNNGDEICGGAFALSIYKTACACMLILVINAIELA